MSHLERARYKIQKIKVIERPTFTEEELSYVPEIPDVIHKVNYINGYTCHLRCLEYDLIELDESYAL